MAVMSLCILQSSWQGRKGKFSAGPLLVAYYERIKPGELPARVASPLLLPSELGRGREEGRKEGRKVGLIAQVSVKRACSRNLSPRAQHIQWMEYAPSNLHLTLHAPDY